MQNQAIIAQQAAKGGGSAADVKEMNDYLKEKPNAELKVMARELEKGTLRQWILNKLRPPSDMEDYPDILKRYKANMVKTVGKAILTSQRGQTWSCGKSWYGGRYSTGGRLES